MCLTFRSWHVIQFQDSWSPLPLCDIICDWQISWKQQLEWIYPCSSYQKSESQIQVITFIQWTSPLPLVSAIETSWPIVLNQAASKLQAALASSDICLTL